MTAPPSAGAASASPAVARFTTYERVEEVPLVVVKRRRDARALRPGEGGQPACGSRPRTGPSTDADLDALAAEVEEELRLQGPDVASERVGIAVLERLRRLDQVAAVRFASVYKGFDDPADFAREVTELSKRSP